MTIGVGLDRALTKGLAKAKAVRNVDVLTTTAAPSCVEFARICGFTSLDDWQVRALESTSNRHLLCCTRQAGKSTTTAIRATHEAAYEPGALILILCPSQDQSSELARKMRGLLETPGLDVPEMVGDSKRHIELENGSRIIALPGSETSTRGYSAATTLIIDEAARCEPATITAVMPALATTNGRIIALSTPRGRIGWFYDQWVSGGKTWEKTLVTAHDVPRISKAFLEDQRRLMGQFEFACEFECQFLDADSSVFSSDLIDAAFSPNVQPFF